MTDPNSELKKLEQAYGACHKCYGKGYASHLTAHSGYGTDGDIGGYEGPYYKKIDEMVFCSCDRGKQLEQYVANATREARREELEALKTIFLNPSTSTAATVTNVMLHVKDRLAALEDGKNA